MRIIHFIRSLFTLKLVAVTVLLGLSGVAESQTSLKFDRIGRNEGLSQSSVNCMLRDRDGFMWFGTQDGLNMYDGKKFRVFQNQPGDSGSLSNNYIVSMCEDEDGYLWLGTMAGGLNRFDKRTEQFRSFTHIENRNSISENTVWTVLSDGEGSIWAGTSLGLNRYNKKKDFFTTFRAQASDSSSLISDMVVSLYKDHYNRIWVGSAEGLCMLDKSRHKFTRYLNPGEAELPGANLIWSLSETPSGDIITGTNNGVYLLNVQNGSFLRVLGSPDDIQLVAWSVTAKTGELLIGSDRGLFRLALADRQVKSYLFDPVNPQSIPNNNIWCLLSDPAGFLWCGTNNGICKTKTSAAHFRIMNAEKDQEVRLSSSRVMSVLEDHSGNLWIGTDGGGLNLLGPDRKEVKVFNSANSGLRNDNVWALTEDKEGNIYIGNYQGGLHIYRPKTGIIHAFPVGHGSALSLSNPRVLALLVSRSGKVWIGTRGGGLSCLDPLTGKIKVYQNSQVDTSGLPASTVLCLAEDHVGRIWAGTHEGGLALYDEARDRFITFRNVPGDVTSISDNNVWSIEFDRKGRLWAGTQGGINVCSHPGKTMKFTHFTTRNGLKSNTILGIREDTRGDLWLSTFNGIAKLDMASFESTGSKTATSEVSPLFHPLFYLFDTDHGLQGLEFNQGASHRGISGMLYFAGNNGLNYFSEKDVKASDYRPPIMITGFKVFNKEVGIVPDQGKEERNGGGLGRSGNNYFLKEKITYLKELVLTYRESVISFEFTALDFSNPNKNQYAYKMVNFDEDWNYVGTQNTATYTNLDPGEYIFLIRGSNSDGIWNPEETALRIRIIPPFWKTVWFIVLVAFLLILVVFMILRYVFRNQRQKSLREKELIELQLKTIKSQIDPHFAFNAINTIAGFIYSEKPDVTYDYFTRFARMIRNILEDNEKISRLLTEEVDFVRNYLELQKMRFRDKFDYFIEIDDEIPLDTMVPKMIIQAYAENAIKHGLMHRVSGGELKIKVSKDTSVISVIIEDNGVGRERAAQLSPATTRRGFKIMEQIIELYRKLYHTEISQKIEDLTDLNGQPAGTRVILLIYLNQVKPA